LIEKGKKKQRKISMKRILIGAVIAIGLSSPAFADSGFCLFGCGGKGGGGWTHDAPAPLIGAGLPGLAIGLGYGAYWIARRRRKAS
jgi:hypothetical protein